MGDSLVVQRLGLSGFPTKAQVQSLVRELRSHKPHVVRPNKQTKKSDTVNVFLPKCSPVQGH